MNQPTSDAEIVAQIDALIAEERAIEHRSPDGLSAEDAERVRAMHVERDRLWDLKRERQAMRDAGRDPGEAVERPAEVVERYQQ
jgi:hypothetical protein